MRNHHLHIRRPSPTTAEFTVTTSPPRTPLARLALAALITPLRLALALAALLLLHAAWLAASPPPSLSAPPSPPPSPAIVPAAAAALLARLHPLSARLAALLPAPWALAPAGLALLGLAARRVHTTESLLVLRGLGVQTRSSGATYLPWVGGGGGGGATRFIPTAQIRDVLINEAFRGFEVRHYLVVVVEGEDDVVVVFPRLLPGLGIVEAVWRGLKGCLYEPGGVWGEGEKAREMGEMDE